VCGRSAERAWQLDSSWSREDHEDGGPTIQLPAAETRCTLVLERRTVYNAKLNDLAATSGRAPEDIVEDALAARRRSRE
jgi:hypothetical protein